MPRASLLAVAVTLSLAGCASAPPPQRHDAPKATASSASSAASAAPEAPAGGDVRPDMEALLRERAAFFSADGATVGGATAPPARAGKLPTKGPIATKRVARIDAVAFSGHFGRGPTCRPSEEPLAKDGRLCGDVHLPIATLTEPEKARVLALLVEAEQKYGPSSARNGSYASRPVLRCGFDPHQALLLYDDAGGLLGTITICMTCHEWLVRPASGGTGDGAPAWADPDERATFAAVLDAHGLGAWIFDEDDPRQKAAITYEREVYGTEDDPTPRGIERRKRALAASTSGVDASKKLADLSRAERAALCTWTADVVRPGRRNGGSHGYECKDADWVADYGEADCGK
ncbi:MAG: hypothetical protein U0235_03425 [Polyangiaceae bacterium]